jgi:hypothetical protein
MTKWKNPRIGPAFYMSFRSAAEGFAFQEKYPASYPLQTCQAPKPQIPSPIKAIATPISCPQLAILVIERKKKPRRLSRGFLLFAAKQKHLNHLDVILCSAVTSEINTLRGRSRPKSNDSKTLGLRVGRGAVEVHCFAACGATRSSSRFSSSTFTRGSPRNPNCRPSVCCATNLRTASSERCRSRATR